MDAELIVEQRRCYCCVVSVDFSFEAASYGTNFRMPLERKPPSVLLRNVYKVRVERTETAKYVKVITLF